MSSNLMMKGIVAPMQRSSTLSAVTGTGVLCVLTFWWYGRSVRSQLLQTQRNCREISEKAFQECRAMLKSGEESWGADIRGRDAQVRRLELQNVEQTRSVARLEAAMKMCLIQDD